MFLTLYLGKNINETFYKNPGIYNFLLLGVLLTRIWVPKMRLIQFDSDSNHSLTQKERFYLNAFFIESRAQGNIYLPRSLDLFILILDVVKLA